jgi:hypothetical protein
MSFKNFLDLRKKTQQQTQIIERVVFQKRSLKSDLFLALSVILVASAVIWGISKADNISDAFIKPQTKNFSASGIVFNIDEANLYIDQALGSDDSERKVYTFNLSDNPKIETDKYESVNVSDMQIGSKVVVQGKINGGNITVKRIIYFGSIIPKETPTISTLDIASTTASSTPTNLPGQAQQTFVEQNSDGHLPGQEATNTSTTTDVIANANTTTSTPTLTIQEETTSSSTNSATTTEGSTIIETISDAINDTIDNAGTVINNVVETIIEIVTGETGSSTPPADTESLNTSTTTE